MYLSIRELLRANIFNRSIVIAGHDKIDQIILSVNVLDAPHGCSYVQEGMLVISSGFCLTNKCDQIEIIRELSKRKAAGLMLKLKYFSYDLQETMVREANEIGLPIITLVNDQYTFQEILDFMVNHIYCSETHEFIHKTKLYELFMNIINTEGLKGVLELLHKWTNLNSILFFRKEKISFPKTQEITVYFEEDNIIRGKVLNIVESTIFSTQINHYECPNYTEEEPVELINTELRFKNRVVGSLCLIKGIRPYSKNDYIVLEFASMACKIEIQKQLLIQEEQQKHKVQFLRQLLNNHIENEEAIVKANEFGWQLPLETKIFYIKPVEKINLFDLEIERILSDFFIDVLNFKLVITLYNAAIVALVPAKIPNNIDIEKKLDLFLQSKFKCSAFNIGVGRAAIFKNYNQSYCEAEYACEIGALIRKKDRIFIFEQLGFYRLFCTTSLPKEIQRFYNDYLSQLATLDYENKLDMIKTLKIFLQHGCNYSSAAKELFLHPNTVRYRMQTIEKTCKVDLKNDNDRLNIEIALKLMPLLLENKDKY